MTVQQHIDELIEEHGEEWPKHHHQEICSAVGRYVPHETISRCIRRYRSKKAKIGEFGEHQGVDHKPNPVGMDKMDVVTQVDAEDYFRVPLSELELKEVRHGVWGSPENPNHQTRVTYGPVKKNRTLDQVLELFRDLANSSPVKHKSVRKHKPPKSDNLLEISIPDLHMGLLARKDENGESDWNMDRAEATFLSSVESIIQSSAHHKPERVLFPVGSDYFNVDNQRNTTTGGTPQDEEDLWYETFRRGAELLIQAVEMLRGVAPVEIVVIRGNHDDERSWYLGMFLMAWYRNCDDVEVDTSPQFMKCVEWGECMIGLAHGDKIKPDRYPLLMAYDEKEMWARTRYREVHVGHIHASSGKGFQEHIDAGGVEVRVLSSLAGSSAWTARNGYRHVRKAEGIVWNKHRGQIASNRYNVA